jgi:glycyl-tRNA synthetase beta chain
VTDFLLELLSEEIPARMQEKASADLVRLFEAELAKSGLKPARIDSFVTPRRLALIARDLPDATDAVSEELKGPRADAPEQALAGFLGKTGLTRDQLVERTDAKGNTVLFAVIEKPGRPTAQVLADAVPAIVRAFPWPKAMRWGAASSSTESLRWVRPLQGIVALLGADVVPIAIDGVESGRETAGHRFLHSGAVSIADPDAYVASLRAAHVIASHEERRRIVREGAAKAATDAGFVLIEDEGLVHENAGLTEWPVPLLGTFDRGFLEVPREVIQLTLRTNQKYFVCAERDGALAPAFVCTANIEASDGGAAIVAGNAKVLAARLSDARFFWEQDLKVPLEENAAKLGQIVFHEKLGTVADKVERVAKLARWLVEEGIVGASSSVTPALSRGPDALGADEKSGIPGQARDDGNLADLAERAARLAKADLVTGMVGEFPELQGVMGGYYAARQGEDRQVAAAIRDHYKPVGQGDEVPTAPVTVAVSLADKLDTIIEFFRIDLKPTGSKDPFALRRAAIGILAIVIESGLRVRLSSVPGVTAEVLDFFADRLKVQQREAGVRHDLIDAVFALGGEDDLVRLLARVKALQAFVETDDGANLLAGYRRAANILRAEAKKGTVPAPFTGFEYTPDPAEAALATALDTQLPIANAAIAKEDFSGGMTALSVFRPTIDSFFDDVTVNSEEDVKRLTRLALLEKLRAAMHNIADFSKIEGS